jgi:hypothetical protein
MPRWGGAAAGMGTVPRSRVSGGRGAAAPPVGYEASLHRSTLRWAVTLVGLATLLGIGMAVVVVSLDALLAALGG